jgi:DNA-directed RNA polymerase subunit H (RpoH/RPB5)
MEEDNKMSLLLTIKKNQIEMVRNRGYTIPEDEEIIFDNDISFFSDFLSQQKDAYQLGRKSEKFKYKGKNILKPNIDFRFVLKNEYENIETNKNFLVLYLGKYYSETADSIKLESMVFYINYIEKMKSMPSEIILIINANITPQAFDALEIFTQTNGIRYQIFNDHELFYNPIQFVDYSKHTLISEDEEEELLKNMKVVKSKMLVIGIRDPIIKYYNWPENRIVRIERDDIYNSSLSQKSINYRVIKQLISQPQKPKNISKKQLIDIYKKDMDSWEL